MHQQLHEQLHARGLATCSLHSMFRKHWLMTKLNNRFCELATASPALRVSRALICDQAPQWPSLGAEQAVMNMRWHACMWAGSVGNSKLQAACWWVSDGDMSKPFL